MDVVFTKHALERMEQRTVSKEMVLQAISKPNRTYPEDDGDTKFIRRVNGVQLHVVCKPLPEEGKWLVKSTWVRGEDDYGYRVDRYGRRLGKVKRVIPQPGQQAPSRLRAMLINGLLIAILIALAIVLIYVLSR